MNVARPTRKIIRQVQECLASFGKVYKAHAMHASSDIETTAEKIQRLTRHQKYALWGKMATSGVATAASLFGSDALGHRISLTPKQASGLINKIGEITGTLLFEPWKLDLDTQKNLMDIVHQSNSRSTHLTDQAASTLAALQQEIAGIEQKAQG